MIQLQRITQTQGSSYEYIERLIIESFPAEEYRELDELRDYTRTKSIFYNNLIIDRQNPVGMVSYWTFDRFYYIEHFAIDPKQRNEGYGKQAISHLKDIFDRPIVLEVEPPTLEISKRRIGFYKRQGFTLWDTPYQQPPYRLDGDFLPMQLMVSGMLSCEKDYPGVKTCLYNNVYGI
ncbi:GNAT family N-acetyltransferase [Bacteroidaceae bacterium HV4-6-C5C]|jgi:ribosomal protein S18 acetylase RimI-like enzyme|nr:GNAT family N-acetyltransferase [Bacteroidaceae bacterium HV4-6-C5C]